jgi:hypothetical protein
MAALLPPGGMVVMLDLAARVAVVQMPTVLCLALRVDSAAMVVMAALLRQ